MFGLGVDELSGSWLDKFMNDTFSTTCPICGTSRTLHTDSLPVIESQGHVCSDCRADADRAESGWTPENSLS